MIIVPYRNLSTKRVKSYLKDVPKDKVFITMTGNKVRNITELYDIIYQMPDDEFSHHLNESRNDFRNWIHHVISDNHLAKLISDCRTKDEMLDKLEKRISNYRIRLERRIEKEKNYLGRVFEDSQTLQVVDDILEDAPATPESAYASMNNTSIDEASDDRADMEKASIDFSGDNLAHDLLSTSHVSLAAQEVLQKEREKQNTRQFILGIIFGIILGFIIARIFI